MPDDVGHQGAAAGHDLDISPGLCHEEIKSKVKRFAPCIDPLHTCGGYPPFDLDLTYITQ